MSDIAVQIAGSLLGGISAVFIFGIIRLLQGIDNESE